MGWLDVLVPVRCPACGRQGAGHAGLCPACAGAALRLRLPADHVTVLAPRLAAVGVFAYDGVVRDAIRGMKVGGRFWAAGPLGAVVRRHPAVTPAWPVTWVPSTATRRRRRGVDLARLLAGPDAVPLLRRTVERPDQTTLTAPERRLAPAGAFRAVGTTPRHVVLVDDVRTTGATARAAAGALLDAGARAVLVATLAVGGDRARAASGDP